MKWWPRTRNRAHLNTEAQTESRLPSPQFQSPLLRLPGEIRNQIYENLVVFSQPVHIYRNDEADQQPPGPNLDVQLLSLFLTCRQVHAEASAIFYSQNTFILPPNSSIAPHQIQANFLFRWFLDRIGPRNAAALRHLAVPFPADPTTLVNAHLSAASSSSSTPEIHNTLIPALAARCPNLESLTFDVRWNNHWVRLLSPNTETVLAMFGHLDDALRSALPALKKVELCLAGPGRKYVFTGPWAGNAVEMPHAEWEWFKGALEGSLEEGSAAPGWRVTTVGEAEEDEELDGQETESGLEDEDDDDDEMLPPTSTYIDGWIRYGSRWVALWYPRTPRDPRAALHEPPEMATTEEVNDLPRGARLVAEVRGKVKFARAWLRSPTQAVRDREAAEEWMEWRRTMIAQAGPYVFPRSCFGQGSVGGESASSSRTRKLARRLRDMFPL